MLYRFDQFEIDTETFELSRNGAPLSVMPLVFDLIVFLCRNHSQVKTRDEIVEAVWGGRIISDSTISSCVKSARKVLGDNGESQDLIRTVRGRGFQFVADVESVAPESIRIADTVPGAREPISPVENSRFGASLNSGASPVLLPDEIHSPRGKPSIAVLPFKLLGMPGGYDGLADAIPHELIISMSRLRWLFVIARGSSFQFRTPDPDLSAIGRALNVRYCLSGAVELFGNSIAVNIELSETGSGELLWGERYTRSLDGVHEIRAEIIANVISELEIQIPLNEALRVQHLAPEHLDAWQAYHMGLKHVHHYTQKDNAAAAVYFERAVKLDPGFARAHAGLSFMHFQNAFMRYTPDRDLDILNARRFAERSVELDPMDPSANFNLGRSHWLVGEIGTSVSWLERATTLSPNYAQGRYARGWADSIVGQVPDAQQNANVAMALSPLDPLLYGMRAVRAMAHMGRGEYADAADWAERAANTARAHFLIYMIAVSAHGLNGDEERAGAWSQAVRKQKRDASKEHFFAAMPFQDLTTRANISMALEDQGF